VNSYQNCNNVIEKFYSIYLYGSDEIFIQEKINKGPNFISFYIKVNHIKNKCRIERILPSYNKIIVKIVKMLKVGKQNLLNTYLRKFYPVPNATAVGIIKLINLGYLFLLGYLLSLDTNNWLGFEPQISELLLISNNTNNKPCPRPAALLRKQQEQAQGEGEIIKNFKKKCKELFKLNKSHNIIILDLAKLINQTLVTASGINSYRIKRFMKNFIHKRS
jgi:hypothetical protein